MLLNTKKKVKKNKYLNSYFKKISKILLFLNLLFFAAVIIFHFSASENLRISAYKKAAFYFLPLESSHYTLENGVRLLKSYFTPINDDDVIIINSNFKNISLYYNQLENKKLRSAGNNFKYSKGKLVYLNESVNIKFKPKGDRDIHYEKNKPSFLVKVTKGKTAINNIQQFSIQNPAIRNYLVELLWYEILKNEKIITPNYSFKKLILNGEDMGIYNIEERPSTFMLERLQQKNSSILKFDESYTTFIDDNPDIKIVNSDEVDIENQKMAASKLKGFIIGKYSLEDTFDTSKMAAFFAISDLLQISHGLYSKSVRLYFNPFTQLLEPIPFDGHFYGKNETQNIYFSFDLAQRKVDEKDNWLPKFFNEKNTVFYRKYYDKLNHYTSNSFYNALLENESFEKKIDHSLNLLYKGLPFEDRLDRIGPFIYLFDPYEFIFKNISEIRKKLNAENIQFFLSGDEIKLLNNNKSKNPIFVNYIKSDKEKYIVNKFFIFDDVNGKTTSKIQIKNKDFLLSLKNNQKLSVVYNDSINKKVNLYEIIDYSNKEKINIYDDVRFIVNQDEIFFRNRKIVVSNNLVIPSNKTLRIKKGQELILDGANLIIHGSLQVLGEKNKLVTISTSKNGGKIVALDGSHYINHTVFENFKNNTNSLYSGSITFYSSDVIIKNSSFINNNSEDYLNLVSSKLLLENLTFIDSFSDSLDIDFSTGIVNNIAFKRSGNDALDVSESILEVKNINISSPGDKGISVGENSKLKITNCVINNGDIGLVVKDGSDVSLNILNTNSIKIPIALYIKKSRYSNPKLKIGVQNSINSEFDYLLQKGLYATINNMEIYGDSKDIEGLFYGSKYGKKTFK
ncbi:CotH kinase family protein [Flavobacteriaceae bacterium]|nr:CotH kinase family protein [Flavobacteriaceae bacterium]